MFTRILSIVLISFCFTSYITAQTIFKKFDFGAAKASPLYTQVLPENIYNQTVGYGFEPGANVTCTGKTGKG